MTDSMRTFIDTNVVVYAYDRTEPGKQERAGEIVDRAISLEEDFAISTQVMLEFYATITRKLDPPVTEEVAVAALEDLSALTVVRPSPELVIDAARLSEAHRLSIWDALIIRSARSAVCDRILTEDLSDGATITGVRIENPFADLT